MAEPELHDQLLKIIRGSKMRHMGWRMQNPSVAMDFDRLRFRRCSLISKERAQIFLSFVLREWILLEELTFADELTQVFDTTYLPIGVAAQEISFFLTGAKVEGLLERLVSQVRPRLLTEDPPPFNREYVMSICSLGEAVFKYDQGELRADEFLQSLNSIRSTHPQINFYLFGVIREYRFLFSFEELGPIYGHLKIQFKDDGSAFQYAKSEHRKLLQQWVRREKKYAARQVWQDKARTSPTHST